MTEETLPAKRGRGRPPRPKPKPYSRKDISDNTKFWLSLQTLATNPFTKKKELLSQLDRMTIKMVKKAMAGNVNAYQALLDRAYGKPKQYTETDINHRVSIAAFAWGSDKLPEASTPIPEPEGEDIEFEPIELPDKEVADFERKTQEAE